MSYHIDRSFRMKLKKIEQQFGRLARLGSRIYLLLCVGLASLLGDCRCAMANTNAFEEPKYKIVVDRTLPEHVMPAYLAYAGSKLVSRQEFHNRYPKEKVYVETIQEQLDAYEAVATVWSELKAKNKVLADKTLDYISAIYSTGYLDSFIMDEYKGQFSQDYERWLTSNGQRLRQYQLWKSQWKELPVDVRLDNYVSVVPDN